MQGAAVGGVMVRLLDRLRGLMTLARGKKGSVHEVSAAEARRLQEQGAIVVDVREGFEHRRARIPGALHIPLGDVAARARELPKDRPIVMHCALGSRSRLAAKHLAGLGFENVHNLEGGFSEWKGEGLPVEPGVVERKE